MTRNRIAALLLVAMMWLLPSHGITDSARTESSSSGHCPPLAPPTGNIVDVSTVKELARRWYPAALERAPVKRERHRALDDIRESVRELEYYRQLVFKNPDDVGVPESE